MSHADIEDVVADGSSYATVIDALIEAGAMVGQPGRSQTWCLCPAHDDHDPSLSVTWRSDGPKGGRTMLSCQLSSPCETADIVAAIGLRMSDLFDTPPRGRGDRSKRTSRQVSGVRPAVRSGVSGSVSRGVTRTVTVTDTANDTDTARRGDMTSPVSGAAVSGAGGGARLELVATYPYTDAEGTILYDIRRWRGGVAKYSARSFDKNGRPRKGMPAPARRVLYRLPEVLAAETVYVDEGEKDADSVAQALSAAAVGSAAATSAPFGAANTSGRGKAVWLPQFVETLRGKHVKIIVDRDRAGYAHGLHVYDAQVGVSASVELLEPAEGNDATDHLTAGRTLGSSCQ